MAEQIQIKYFFFLPVLPITAGLMHQSMNKSLGAAQKQGNFQLYFASFCHFACATDSCRLQREEHVRGSIAILLAHSKGVCFQGSSGGSQKKTPASWKKREKEELDVFFTHFYSVFTISTPKSSVVLALCLQPVKLPFF